MNGNMKILGLLLLMGLAFAGRSVPDYLANQHVRAECIMNYSYVLSDAIFDEGDLDGIYADMEDSMSAMDDYYDEQDYASFRAEFQNLIRLNNQMRVAFLRYGFLYLLEEDMDPGLIYYVFTILQTGLNDCFITGEFFGPMPS